MSDTDWLKKVPTNPVRINLRRSMQRAYVPSPTLDASLMRSAERSKDAIPVLPRPRKTNIKPLRLGLLTKMNKSEPKKSGFARPSFAMKPAGNAQRESQFIRPSMVAAKINSNYNAGSAKPPVTRQTTYFGPRRSAYIHSVPPPLYAKPKPPVPSALPRPATRGPPSGAVCETPLLRLPSPRAAVPRSILKQSEERPSRAPRSPTAKWSKPKAKRVNFDGGQRGSADKENAARGPATNQALKECSVLVEHSICIPTAFSFKPSMADTLSETKLPSLQLQPLVVNRATTQADRSEVIRTCEEYGKKIQTLWDEFMKDLTAKLDQRPERPSSPVGDATRGASPVQGSTVVVDTPKSTNNVTLRKSLRRGRTPQKFMFEDSPPQHDALRKVSAKSVAIKKRDKTEPKNSAKKRLKSKIFKDLQRSNVSILDSREYSSDELTSDSTTPVNTPARQKKMSKKVQLQISKLFES